MKDFYCDTSMDNRLAFACEYLEKQGYTKADTFEKADFTLLGVNPKEFTKYTSKPTFAGNVCAGNLYDYTKDEIFARENAFLTAEGAISLAVENSKNSMINSNILIIGFGRIAKALLHLLKPFSKNITVCARKEIDRNTAKLYGYETITFNQIDETFDYIFNTVPHPVINKTELLKLKDDVMIVDLASFPGGVDMHYANVFKKNVIVARGLPAKYSPKTAGEAVAKSVLRIIEREELDIWILDIA